MTLELSKTTDVAVLVYLETDFGNMIGWVVRQQDEPWEGGYRFRYIVDNKLQSGSKDRKSFYGLKPKAGTPADEAKETLRNAITGVFLMSGVQFGTVPDFFAVDCTGTEAMDVLFKKPWANAFNAPGGDA